MWTWSGYPNRAKVICRALITLALLVVFKGTASNHLLKTSFSVNRYLLPSALALMGPITSMLQTWNGAPAWTLGR